MKSFVQWFTLSSKMMHIFTLLMIFYMVVPKIHAFRGDEYRIDKPRFYSEATCLYQNENGKQSKCYCPKFHTNTDEFRCICNDMHNNDYTNQFLCECKKHENRLLSDCTCINLRKTIKDLKCTLTHYEKDKGTILLGVIIPYTFGEAAMTSYSSGMFYASAMFLAIDDVNNNKDLLPNHKLSLVWADTECDWKKTIKVQLDMIKEQNVDAFIGGGCAGCEAVARNAGAENIPMISHVSVCMFLFFLSTSRFTLTGLIIISKTDGDEY